ncbi:hypothetical protein CBS101457_000981 [Exobasidium rhododendri]|nr:hypothetical protein CBS101457_000981 [Exobasidium rhododendri]
MDAAAGDTEEANIRRKKSWGAGVDDDNALSEPDDQEEAIPPTSTRMPLHLDSFGSRFISHLPSLPLCSAYLEIPPPLAPTRAGQRLLRRSIPESVKRHVLLVGTTNGLYVVECRKKGRQESFRGSDSFKKEGKVEGKKREEGGKDWNDDIRCRQIWSGVGVYQMSTLTTKTTQAEYRGWKSSFPMLAPPPQDVGIFLALCSKSKDRAKGHASHLNSQGYNPTLDPANTAGVYAGKESGALHLATSYFGVDGGGGPGKLVPSGGSGAVRMWSLEAVRRIVSHTLDAAEPKIIDLLRNPSTIARNAEGKSRFTSRLRRAWASLGDPPNEGKGKRSSRLYASMGLPGDQTKSSTDHHRDKFSAGSEIPSAFHQQQRSDSRISTYSEQSNEFGQLQDVVAESNDDAYDESLRLALSSVTVTLPAGGSNASGHSVNLGQGDSSTSLFSDESMGAGAVSTSGHSSNSGSHAGRGVLFFTVFETAGSETGGRGTWYMALACPRSIYLYEAVRPTNAGEVRSWIFIKEYCTPVPPKGISFIYSEAAGSAKGMQNRQHQKPHRRQQLLSTSPPSSIPQESSHHQVNSSPYSSVFRSDADLTLFVSFGKTAVLIRASDSGVKEVDLFPLERNIHDATSSDTDHHKSHHHSHTGSQSKRRSLSVELLSGDGITSKEQWIGVEKVTSQVLIRCKHHTPLRTSVTDVSDVSQQGLPRFEDGEDDDDVDSDDHYDGQGVTLQDIPSPLQSRILDPSPGQGVHGNPSRVSTSVEPAHVLVANIAIVSKGNTSLLYPLPLPWNSPQQRLLGSFQWSETPTAVTAWSKVIGLERDFSSGGISINSLGSSSKINKKVEVQNMLMLHVRVTAVAFLPSRVERKKLLVKVQIKVPFSFNRDSELELESMTTEREQQFGDDGYEDEDEEKAEEAELNHLELEYLCGMLNVAPRGNQTIKPWEAAGDGGIWGFDWRGADDFRLFYVSARV